MSAFDACQPCSRQLRLRLTDTSYDPTAKVAEEVNRKYRPRNMMVQLSTPYTDSESHKA